MLLFGARFSSSCPNYKLITLSSTFSFFISVHLSLSLNVCSLWLFPNIVSNISISMHSMSVKSWKWWKCFSRNPIWSSDRCCCLLLLEFFWIQNSFRSSWYVYTISIPPVLNQLAYDLRFFIESEIENINFWLSKLDEKYFYRFLEKFSSWKVLDSFFFFLS